LSIGGARIVLGGAGGGARCDSWEEAEESINTELGETSVEVGFGLVTGERDGFLGVDRSGVHSADEFHDRDTSLGCAIEDGRLDRAGSAVEGEKRRVEIEDAVGFKEVEDGLADELAVGR
jgi:hypothetical protein